MTFIAHDKAFCLFPYATFQMRSTLHLYAAPVNPRRSQQHAARQASLSSQFQRVPPSIHPFSTCMALRIAALHPTPPDFDEDRHRHMVIQDRRVGDGHSWMIPVHPPLPELAPSFAEINSFSVITTHYEGPHPTMQDHCYMHYQLLEGYGLVNYYLVNSTFFYRLEGTRPTMSKSQAK